MGCKKSRVWKNYGINLFFLFSEENDSIVLGDLFGTPDVHFVTKKTEQNSGSNQRRKTK